LNFIFDNNLPPAWAAAIAKLGERRFEHGQVGEVIHLTSKFPANTPDLQWLTALGEEQGTRWTIISRDGFRKQKGAERQVQRQRGLSVFVLQKSWANKPYWEMTAQLVHWWPRIVEQACATDRVAMEVPWSTSGRFTQI
jgi:hypothetical protein